MMREHMSDRARPLTFERREEIVELQHAREKACK